MSAKIVTQESTALRLVQTRPLACVMLDIIARVQQRHPALRTRLPKVEPFAQLEAIVSRALLGPSTAKAATTIQKSVKRPSLIVFNVNLANGVLEKLSVRLMVTVLMATTALQHLQSMINGQRTLALTRAH
jgi:hypothetical protein